MCKLIINATEHVTNISMGSARLSEGTRACSFARAAEAAKVSLRVIKQSRKTRYHTRSKEFN